MPGLIQTHLHLCQTLFRGMADDLVLMDWLRTRVWPLEAAHTPASLRASARLAACELLLGGTTAVLTMETVHDTDVVCEEIAQSGLRATIGKCLMDADPDVPARLRETDQDGDRRGAGAERRVGWHGRRPPPRRLRAALCRVVLARTARGGRRAVGPRRHARAHARLRVARRGRPRAGTDRHGQPAVSGGDRPGVAAPLRRALRVGRRRGAGADRRPRRQGHALPGLESQARLGPGARRRAASARGHRLAGRRRRGVQQPARHVRRDAAGGRASGRPPGTWPAVRARGGVDGHARTAPARSGSTPRSARSRSASGPTSSWSAAVARIRRRRTTPTRRWSTRPRPATSGRRRRRARAGRPGASSPAWTWLPRSTLPADRPANSLKGLGLA